MKKANRGNIFPIKDAMIMLFVNPLTVFSLASRMADNEPILVKNEDAILPGLNLYLFAHKAEGNRITVGLKSDHAIPGHMADCPLLELITGFTGMRQQQIPFLIKHLNRLSVSGAVDSVIGHFDDPVDQRFVEVIQRGKILSSEEALNILDAGFDLAFGLGPVGSMCPGPESIIGCKIPKRGIPIYLTAFKIPRENHGFGVVIDKLMRKATKKIKGIFMAFEQRGKLLVPCTFGENAPAVAQGHNKKVNPDQFIGQVGPALPPIYLSLFTWRRFKSNRGLDMSFFPQGPYKKFHCFIATRIALLLKFFKDGLSTVTDCGQTPVDIIFIGQENALAFC
jgi:hypothetical protein